jgi:hypothetical protein
MRTFKMYSRNTKATNEPTATNNKSDRPHEHLGHLKDIEMSKYKRESKARMPITFCCLILLTGLFSFLNIKKVKI